MMKRLHALELVALAREALLEQVVPLLDGDARYQGLMAANALAIASRALSVDDRHDERARLCEIYGETLDPDLSLEAMNARLARDIRRGDMDGAVELDLRRLLRAQVRARLAVCNPRRVEAPCKGR